MRQWIYKGKAYSLPEGWLVREDKRLGLTLQLSAYFEPENLYRVSSIHALSPDLLAQFLSEIKESSAASSSVGALVMSMGEFDAYVRAVSDRLKAASRVSMPVSAPVPLAASGPEPSAKRPSLPSLERAELPKKVRLEAPSDDALRDAAPVRSFKASSGGWNAACSGKLPKRWSAECSEAHSKIYFIFRMTFNGKCLSYRMTIPAELSGRVITALHELSSALSERGFSPILSAAFSIFYGESLKDAIKTPYFPKDVSPEGLGVDLTLPLEVLMINKKVASKVQGILDPGVSRENPAKTKEASPVAGNDLAGFGLGPSDSAATANVFWEPLRQPRRNLVLEPAVASSALS